MELSINFHLQSKLICLSLNQNPAFWLHKPLPLWFTSLHHLARNFQLLSFR